MKKLLLLLSVFTAAQVYGQITSIQFGGIKVPQYAASSQGGSYALPVVFRAHVNNLKPNKPYKYFCRAISISDTSSKASYPGAGNPIFLDSGNWKTTTSPSWSSASGHDTFWTNGAGDYEGWFGFVITTDSRFNPGKYIHPIIFAIGPDTMRTYSVDSIKMLAFGKGNSVDSCTGIWGKSLATAKSFVALYDNVNGTGRPLSMTMVENDGVTIPSSVAYYSSNVEGVNGNWGALIPNKNANGVQRIEKLDRYTGIPVYANTDADGKWGPSNKNTINPNGSRTSPIALDENDAALISPMVEFWARTSTVSEGVGTKEIYVVRKYSNSQPQSVRISLVGGTAVKGAGNDFTLTEPRTITFQPGAQKNDTTKIAVLDDALTEGDETVVVKLDLPNNCIIGTEVAHTMTITDNDVASITIPTKLVVVKENAGTAGLRVKIDNAVSSPSTLQLIVVKKGDSSYIPQEFKLGKSYKDSVFTLGKTTGPDSITIKSIIIDDLVGDPHDTFILAIRQKSGLGTVGKDSLGTIVALDNDGPAYIRFVDKQISVGEAVGSVKVRIKIVSKTDAGGDFTLRVLTAGSTATQGTDFSFSPTSQIINIDAASPDTISVSVPIIDDTKAELTENILFNLGILSNVRIQKPDSMNIKIIDNDLPLYGISTISKQNKAGKVADSLNVKCRVTGTVHGGNMKAGGGLQFTIMDKTSGAAVTSATKSFGYTVTEGDSIMVQGTVTQVQGLVTMDLLDTIIVIAKNRTLRVPNVATDVDETTENRMTKFNRVILVNSTDWPSSALSANTNKYVRVKHTDGTVDTMVIDAETNIDGTPAPTGYINVTGIGGQFDATNPFSGFYNITPRYLADIVPASLPVVSFKKVLDTVTELADSFSMGFTVLPLDENFTFDVAVKGGTGVSPTDYNFNTRTISVIKNNSVSPIKCNISDDAVSDGDKTVIFAIRRIQGPGSIGKDSLLTLTILDDEPKIKVKTFAGSNIKMYPNPASRLAYISSDKTLEEVSLIGLDGRKIWSSASEAKQFEIPLQVAAGLYLVKVKTKAGDVYCEPLVVK